MKTGALQALGDRYGLAAPQLTQLGEILAVLQRDERAPTAVRSVGQALDVHVADSLVALELDLVAPGDTIADLGTGAGFPGLPLAVAVPEARFTLLESRRQKCQFVQRVCAAASIGNVEVACVRVEDWSEGRGGQDVVLARALAAQAVVLEYAAPLLRMGGALIDWRGSRDPEEEARAATAAAELGLRLEQIRHTHPYPQARDHHLHVYVKRAPTPPRFPRRAGVARKRPLGC